MSPHLLQFPLYSTFDLLQVPEDTVGIIAVLAGLGGAVGAVIEGDRDVEHIITAPGVMCLRGPMSMSMPMSISVNGNGHS